MTNKKNGKALTIYLFIILALAVLGLCALWIFLGHYDSKAEQVSTEKAEITNKKLETFQDFFSSTTPEYWTDLWFETNPDSLDSFDAVREYMQDSFFTEDTNCWRSVRSTAETPVYVIKKAEQPLAEVTLEMTAEGDWTIAKPVFQIKGEREKSITVPSDCVILCNGTTLDEEWITEKDIDYFFVAEYAEERENPLLWNTWKVSGLLLEPDLTVVSPQERELTEVGENTFFYLCDPELSEKSLVQVKDFAEKLIAFFMNGSNLTAYNAKKALNCVREGSQADEVIRSVVRGIYLGTYYENYQLDYSCGPFVQWADNCIGCDVDYIITNIDEDQTGRLRIVLMDFGKGYEICGLGVE